MRSRIPVLAFLLILSSNCLGYAEEGLDSLYPKDLVGTYQIIAGENSGEPAPKQRIDGVLVRFTETAVVVTDPTNKHVYAAAYELGTAENPAKIRMISTLDHDKGATASGLIQKDGETLKLIYKLPGAEEPTKFETQKGQLMFILSRVPE